MTIEKNILKIIRNTIRYQRGCETISFENLKKIINNINKELLVSEYRFIVYEAVENNVFVVENRISLNSIPFENLTVPKLMNFLVKLVKESGGFNGV